MKRTITIDEANIENVSDGFHTFKELYAHRCHLFAALMRSHPDISWRSRQHEDGSMYDGEWFIAGMRLPTGDISYHLPLWMWKWFDGSSIDTLERAPRWDGHSPADVLERLHSWCTIGEACWPIG